MPASLPNLPCAIFTRIYHAFFFCLTGHVSDSEAYFTGVELSLGCYSIGVKSFVLFFNRGRKIRGFRT